MGCLGSKDPTNAHIQNHMKHDEVIEKTTRKLLLLGAGASGKSTILKQMRYLWVYHNGYPDSEKTNFRCFIFQNLVELFSILLTQIEEVFDDIEIEDENKQHAQTLWELDKGEAQWENSAPFPPDLKEAIIALRDDSGIQEAFEERHRFVVMDNAKYFMDNIDRILAPDYLPTFADITLGRNRTTGVTTENFLFSKGTKGKARYQIVDVGGQRSERKKWFKCFADVVAVLYCIALSAYNQTLWEDFQVNRMREAFALFQETIGNKHLRDTNMIVFLNKRDLFDTKIGRIPFTICFNEDDGFYGDAYDYDNVIDFIRNKLTKIFRLEHPDKSLHFHITCATDTNDIDRVFTVVHDIIIQHALIKAGMA